MQDDLETTRSGFQHLGELQSAYENAVESGARSRRLTIVLYVLCLLVAVTGVFVLMSVTESRIDDRISSIEKRLKSQAKEASNKLEEYKASLAASQERVSEQSAQIAELEAATRLRIEALRGEMQKYVEEQRKEFYEQFEVFKTDIKNLADDGEKLLAKAEELEEGLDQLLVRSQTEIDSLQSEASRLVSEQADRGQEFEQTLDEARTAKNQLLRSLLGRGVIRAKEKATSCYKPAQICLSLGKLEGRPSDNSRPLSEIRVLDEGEGNRQIWPASGGGQRMAPGSSVAFSHLGCEMTLTYAQHTRRIFKDDLGFELTWADGPSGSTKCRLTGETTE